MKSSPTEQDLSNYGQDCRRSTPLPGCVAGKDCVRPTTWRGVLRSLNDSDVSEPVSKCSKSPAFSEVCCPDAVKTSTPRQNTRVEDEETKQLLAHVVANLICIPEDDVSVPFPLTPQNVVPDRGLG